MQGINSASGYMRHELGKRLSLRYVPDLTFVLDHSLDQAEHIYQLLDGLAPDAAPDNVGATGESR